jgi:hypothetical protein
MPGPEKISDRVDRWRRQEGGVKYALLHSQIEFLDRHLFFEYEPTSGPAPGFLDRCRDWLSSAVEERDQQVMFELVPNLFFVGAAQFWTLYRMAMNEHIVRWLISELDLKYDDPAMSEALAEGVQRTWFCGVTDSMNIAAFYHANHISGVNYRPDWHSLSQFGTPERIQEYMASHNLERIVLLEDFVGSGSQLKRVAKFVSSLPWSPPTMLVPLITCPGGYKEGRKAERNHASVTFSPVLSLPPGAFVARDPTPGEPELISRLRETAARVESLVHGSGKVRPAAFGFKGTGALVVMYTNCPNNTLPLVHHRSDQWTPLFPRSSRM